MDRKLAGGRLSGRPRSSVQVAQKRRKELLASTPGVVYERLVYNTFQTLCVRERLKSRRRRRQRCSSSGANSWLTENDG